MVMKRRPNGQQAPWEPTDEQRNTIRALATFGLPHENIATVIGVDKQTLYKHCRPEIDEGMARGNMAIGQSLFQQATGRPAEYAPNPTGKGKPVLVREELKPVIAASIFLGKNRLGLRDRQDVAMSIEDIDPSALTDQELKELGRLLAKANRRAAKGRQPPGEDPGGS